MRKISRKKSKKQKPSDKTKIILDKFRTRWDFFIYVGRKSYFSSILYLSGLFFAISGLFFTSLTLSLGSFIGLAGVVFALIGYFHDWSVFKKHEKYDLVINYEFSIDNIGMCESDMLIDQGIGEYTRLKVTLNEYENNYDYIFMSSKLNEYLWDSSHQLKLELNHTKEDEIAELIKENWDSLSHYLIHSTAVALRDKKAFYNEKKLCMGNGFRLTEDKSTLIANCSKGSYYDSYLTNNIFEKFLNSTHGDMDRKYASAAFHNMKPYFNRGDQSKTTSAEADTLRAFKNLLLNNEFGISTIAITRDHYAFQLIQSKRAMASGCLIAPSGSGSCDYEDIHGNDFRKSITYAMQRELWEEIGFKCPKRDKRQRVEDFGQTYLVGFFRWLKRNGKPEFLGISYIDIDYKEIKPNTAEVKRKAILSEALYTINDFKRYLNRVKNETTPQPISDHIGVSVPLLACVTALEELLKDEKTSKKIANILHLKFC